MIIFMRFSSYFCHQLFNSRAVGPIFCFQNCAGLMHFDSVPDSLWYLDAEELFARTEAETSHFNETLFVKSCLAVMYRTTSIHVWKLFVEYLIETAF